MNRLYIFCTLSAILFSCSENEPLEPTIEIKQVEAIIPDADNFDYDTLTGLYKGDFGGSDIRIILNYVSGSNVIGYNIHKGLQRNLNGKVERNGDSVRIVLNEPGDHEYDGVFELLFIGIDKKPTGTWKSNSGEIAEKSFKLEKEAKAEMDGEINSSNFASYFTFLSDTLGNYSFQNDGLCRYEYYPTDIDESQINQMTQVNGSWSLTDSIITIDWQENQRFKNRRMVFIIHHDGEYEESYLKGEGMTLYKYWY